MLEQRDRHHHADGSVCTRACRFCAVDTGNPKGWLDAEEPENTAKSVELMGLRYVVLTSVDRDDLPDGGATHYADCIRAIKARTPEVAVEALTPDFDAVPDAIERVVDSGLEVFAQNVETVERLTHRVRDPRAGYRKTLDVLAHAKRHRPGVITKTSLMLGLGETDEEILQTFDDLRAIGVDIVTLGQYLRPTRNHLPVERWVTPEEFERYRQLGLEKGFMEVPSGPLVRSSYRADRVFENNNLGLELASPGKVPGQSKQEADPNLIPTLNVAERPPRTTKTPARRAGVLHDNHRKTPLAEHGIRRLSRRMTARDRAPEPDNRQGVSRPSLHRGIRDHIRHTRHRHAGIATGIDTLEGREITIDVEATPWKLAPRRMRRPNDAILASPT